MLIFGGGNQGGGNQGNGRGGRDVPKPIGPGDSRGTNDTNGWGDKFCEWVNAPFCSSQ